MGDHMDCLILAVLGHHITGTDGKPERRKKKSTASLEIKGGFRKHRGRISMTLTGAVNLDRKRSNRRNIQRYSAAIPSIFSRKLV